MRRRKTQMDNADDDASRFGLLSQRVKPAAVSLSPLERGGIREARPAATMA
jgi:hypothetical protein